MPKTKADVMADLIERAGMDEHSVLHLIEAGPTISSDEVIGNLAQQMVEKLAKAVLLTMNVKFGSNHDLKDHFDTLQASGNPVPSDLDELKKLTPFANRWRYEPRGGNARPLDRHDLARMLVGFREWALGKIMLVKSS